MSRQPIVFDLSLSSQTDQRNDKQRALKQRAERFGVPEPRRHDAPRNNVITNINLNSKEELAKSSARAARFNYVAPEVAARLSAADTAGASVEKKTEQAPDSATEGTLMEIEVQKPRKEVDPDVTRRPEAIYVHGVDVMSTSDVFSYFLEHSPIFVEWVNDSSCVVVFGDRNQCRSALAGCSTALAPEEGSSTAGMDPEDLANLPFLWRQGKPFAKQGTEISLTLRMATIEDVKDPEAYKTSRRLWRHEDDTPLSRPRWQRRPRGDGPQRQPPSSSRGDEEQDGDVVMGGKRKRGGRRLREKEERKRQMAVDGTAVRRGGDDVDMEDAQEEGELEDDGGSGDVQPVEVDDLRQLLNARRGLLSKLSAEAEEGEVRVDGQGQLVAQNNMRTGEAGAGATTSVAAPATGNVDVDLLQDDVLEEGVL